jgi:Fe-S cluster biogenesis protein NfuA
MFVQTQETPNPNSLKFLPGKQVSEDGLYEILNKNETNNSLIRNILSISGVTGVFLGEDFLSVNKKKDIDWENIKHIVISHINEYYAEGNESIIKNKKNTFDSSSYSEIEKKIIKILETKVRPAVARDGGDIKFKEFKDGKVKVELQGSCSGCPSSTLTLKQGVQNLLCHYVPEVKEVLAV